MSVFKDKRLQSSATFAKNSKYINVFKRKYVDYFRRKDENPK